MAETVYQYFFGMMGVTTAIGLSCLGAGYGTAKCSVGLFQMGTMRPELVMKSLLPPILAGVIGIYGLILGVVILGAVPVGVGAIYPAYKGFLHLAAGLSGGLSGLAAGFSIGIIGDAGLRAYGVQPRLYSAMILTLIFAEALAIYGLIIGLVLATKSS